MAAEAEGVVATGEVVVVVEAEAAHGEVGGAAEGPHSGLGAAW